MTGPPHWIGTSGFQYPEWKGKFYPEDLSTAKMLTYYASRFNSTEVNYTFRTIPSAKTVRRWCDETPKDFRFSLKAPQRVTHFAKLKDCAQSMTEFFTSVSGLADKLGPVLLQLPRTFKADAPRLQDFLLSAATPGKKATKRAPRRLAFEFRHESWLTDEIFGILSEHDAALCIADSEEFTTPFIATASFGYLRPRREDYTPGQIKKLARQVNTQLESNAWEEVFAYLKHEETCVGPRLAKLMHKALAG